jgi:ElaB/YqjD/DUF883 family membrane-anchored ribosome-binding protein
MSRSTNGSHRTEGQESERNHKKDAGPNEIFTFTEFDLSAAEDYVRRKPQNSLLIAFAAGFLASILLRRK